MRPVLIGARRDALVAARRRERGGILRHPNVYPAYTCAATGVYARGGTNYTQNCTVKLVPNFAWCHRGAGEMQTRCPTSANLAEAQTDVQTTFSHVNTGSTDVDTITALYGGITPDNVQSGQTLRRMMFWNHVGTSEWIQYTYLEPTTIRRVGERRMDRGMIRKLVGV